MFSLFSILLWNFSNIYKSRKNAVINPVCKSPSSVIIHPRSIHSLYVFSLPRLFQVNSGYSIISSVIYFRTNLCKIQSPFSNDLIITVTLVECTSLQLVYRIFALPLLYWGGKREGLLWWIRLRQTRETRVWLLPVRRRSFLLALVYFEEGFVWIGWVLLLCKYGCVNMQ